MTLLACSCSRLSSKLLFDDASKRLVGMPSYGAVRCLYGFRSVRALAYPTHGRRLSKNMRHAALSPRVCPMAPVLAKLGQQPAARSWRPAQRMQKLPLRRPPCKSVSLRGPRNHSASQRVTEGSTDKRNLGQPNPLL